MVSRGALPFRGMKQKCRFSCIIVCCVVSSQQIFIDMKRLRRYLPLLDRMHGLDLYDYGARQYDPTTARFTSIDPLCEKYYHISPYAYCAGNPVNYVDPDGMSPIYDPEGNFLGTDDLGLKGMYFVLDREKFVQGMSPADVAWNAIREELSDEVKERITSHYNSLKNRPDYDGFVTIREGIAWAKQHPNALDNPTPDNMLYIDASKLDFGNVSMTSVINKEGNANLFNAGNFFCSLTNQKRASSVYALGRVRLEVMDVKSKRVKVYNDYKDEGSTHRATDYDWNIGKGFIRSLGIYFERIRSNIPDDAGFRVYYYGMGKLNR